MNRIIILCLLLWPISGWAATEWSGTIGPRTVECTTSVQVPFGRADVVLGEILRCRGTKWHAIYVQVDVIDRQSTLHVEGMLCRFGAVRRRTAINPTRFTPLRGCCAFTTDTAIEGVWTPVPDWPETLPYVPVTGMMTGLAGAAACRSHPRRIAGDINKET
jgi:hypothetical protein